MEGIFNLNAYKLNLSYQIWVRIQITFWICVLVKKWCEMVVLKFPDIQISLKHSLSRNKFVCNTSLKTYFFYLIHILFTIIINARSKDNYEGQQVRYLFWPSMTNAIMMIISRKNTFSIDFYIPVSFLVMPF